MALAFTFFSFYVVHVALCILLYVLYDSVLFCKLCILLLFYVCSVLGILFHCAVLCIVWCVNVYRTTVTECKHNFS
jgi:hypothetical protein